MKAILSVLVFVVAMLFLTGNAFAQDECPPEGCEDTGLEELVVPATPEQCPYGGIVFIGIYPVCNGAPGATGAQGPAGAAGPVVVQNTTIPAAMPAPVQHPTCYSRRIVNFTIPQRFRWGQRVWLQFGNRIQKVYVRHNHRLRASFEGMPCGLYSVIVRKKGKRPFKKLYITGPFGNITGINLPSPRAVTSSVSGRPLPTWQRMVMSRVLLKAQRRALYLAGPGGGFSRIRHFTVAVPNRTNTDIHVAGLVMATRLTGDKYMQMLRCNATNFGGGDFKPPAIHCSQRRGRDYWQEYDTNPTEG